MNEFARRLEGMRAGAAERIDDALLTSRAWTQVVEPRVDIDCPVFVTKRDAGRYLQQALQPVRGVGAKEDAGIWSWLSAWFFDSLCPIDALGHRKVRAIPHYVFDIGEGRGRSEHLLFTSTVVYEVAPDSKLVLEGPISSLTRAGHEIGGRLAFLRTKELLKLLDHLYWDDSTNAIKTGASSSDYPGNFRSRLHRRLLRLRKTYDLTDLNADRLLDLLGEEFKAWERGIPARLKSSTT